MRDELPLLNLLSEVESCLKQLGLWDDKKPSDESLVSTEPFAMDTLTPEQWIQWIFIPRMRVMINQQQTPKKFSLSPYFEEVWKSDLEKSELIKLIRIIDRECQ